MESALAVLEKSVKGDNRVIGVACDVASKEQVARFIEQTHHEFGDIQVLVNNAGILGPMGRTEDIDADEWRSTLEVNLFGTLFCSQELIPHFKSRSYGKIINLSGGGATSPRPFFSAYAASKAAVVRLTENLSEELKEFKIDVNAIAPGALPTRMMEQVLEAGAERAGEAGYKDAVKQQTGGGSSPERAAQLCVYLASAESDGITGRLISAPWDPWETLHHRKAELIRSDIYTLRRIIPEDRGKEWQN
jgi:NAD(P)-dependent dehydrogenase (short-subunit alcohol dehydrogenase family)